MLRCNVDMDKFIVNTVSIAIQMASVDLASRRSGFLTEETLAISIRENVTNGFSCHQNCFYLLLLGKSNGVLLKWYNSGKEEYSTNIFC